VVTLSASKTTETAILAGGCFWGVGELLRRRDGSSRPASDPPAGRTRTRPTGTIPVMPMRSSRLRPRAHLLPGHPRVLLSDPRPDNRSEIFYTSEEQRRVAEDTVADVDASGLWPGKVVTEISTVAIVPTTAKFPGEPPRG
jgi:peptide-methionine (S)-S-oxide reductase